MVNKRQQPEETMVANKKRKQPEDEHEEKEGGTIDRSGKPKLRRILMQSWGRCRFRVAEEPIGRGAYGLVYRTRMESTVELGPHCNKELAMKVITPEASGANEARLEWDVVERIRRRFPDLGSVNIIDIYDTGVNETGQFLSVMEKMDAPLSWVVRQKRFRLPQLIEARIVARILAGMHACHQAGVAHMDLKPDNVMLRGKKVDGNDVRVIDFSLARSPEEIQRMGARREHMLQTRWYRAPENCDTKRWPSSGFAADVWSVGCIMVEVLCANGFVAFPAPTDGTQIHMVDKVLKTRKLQSDMQRCNVSPCAIDLVMRMLTVDPTKRITFEQIRNHNYFKHAFPETQAIFEAVLDMEQQQQQQQQNNTAIA